VRSVFNGRVQRGLYNKEETASPTVSQDAFLLTSIINPIEGRDVAVTDIRYDLRERLNIEIDFPHRQWSIGGDFYYYKCDK